MAQVQYLCVVCSAISDQRRCPTHRRRPPKTGAWSTGSTRSWRKLREQVLYRDQYRCQIPGVDGKPCGAPATHCDHIVPKSNGGTDVLTNLRAACAACNLRRGASI